MSGDTKPFAFHTNKKAYIPTERVKMRLLYTSPLNVNFQTNALPTSILPIDYAIIHFHGGGFCSGDSASHQNYTRVWAKELGVPVFSVDYRLAPNFPYPYPVNDCYQAYVWIATQAKAQLGMDIKHFILVGDSAGGHLATSVSLLAAIRGFRIPDGIVMHYPVFTMDIFRFFPS